MIHLVTFFTNQIIDIIPDIYWPLCQFVYVMQASYLSFCYLKRAKRIRQDGLSCFIRTINSKETSNLSWMFSNYSNNLFSYRWFSWCVSWLLFIWINTSFLGTKPTHATNHEFSLCQSKGSNQWISTLHGNCEEAHLDFGSV